MNILVVSQYFYPEKFKINDLIFSLKKRGHQITVLTGKPNYSKTHFFDGYGWKSDDFETINDIPVYRANLFSRRNGGAIRLFLNYISFAILALLKLEKSKAPLMPFLFIKHHLLPSESQQFLLKNFLKLLFIFGFKISGLKV